VRPIKENVKANSDKRFTRLSKLAERLLILQFSAEKEFFPLKHSIMSLSLLKVSEV